MHYLENNEINAMDVIFMFLDDFIDINNVLEFSVFNF